MSDKGLKSCAKLSAADSKLARDHAAPLSARSAAGARAATAAMAAQDHPGRHDAPCLNANGAGEADRGNILVDPLGEFEDADA